MLMKKTFLFAAALLASGAAFAEPLVDDGFFRLEQLPAELTGTVFPGKDIEFSIEENASTGYVWSAVYDPRVCRVQFDHKTPRGALPGAPGYVEVEIKPLTPAPCVVVLNYSRPFEPDKAPVRSVKCTVSTAGSGAPVPPAPVAPGAPAPAPAAPVAPAAPAPAPAAPAAPAVVAAVPAAPVTIPAGTPLVADDAFFRLSGAPAALQANFTVGQEIDFELQEYPEKGMFWRVTQYDARFCRVKVEHDAADHLLESSKAEVEIKAVAAGSGYVDFSYGSGAEARTLRVYLTVL